MCLLRSDDMTGKRYFYTDPLAAAWMSKHFGMETYIGHLPDNYDAYGPSNWHHCVDDYRYRQEKLRQPPPLFYVHPDSLKLLEPQTGDLVEDTGLKGVWPVYGTVAVFVFPIESADAAIGVNSWCTPAKTSAMRIVRRNGIAFHMPESEEA
jgi:hypothetical protein